MLERYRDTEVRSRRSPVTRLLPWLLAVCLVCFVLWAALGIFEALTGAPLLA